MSISHCLVEIFINYCLIVLRDLINTFTQKHCIVFDRDLHSLLFELSDSIDSIFPKGGKLVESVMELLNLLRCDMVINVDVNCISDKFL